MERRIGTLDDPFPLDDQDDGYDDFAARFAAAEALRDEPLPPEEPIRQNVPLQRAGRRRNREEVEQRRGPGRPRHVIEGNDDDPEVRRRFNAQEAQHRYYMAHRREGIREARQALLDAGVGTSIPPSIRARRRVAIRNAINVLVRAANDRIALTPDYQLVLHYVWRRLAPRFHDEQLDLRGIVHEIRDDDDEYERYEEEERRQRRRREA